MCGMYKVLCVCLWNECLMDSLGQKDNSKLKNNMPETQPSTSMESCLSRLPRIKFCHEGGCSVETVLWR